MSIGRRMDQQTVVYTYGVILFSLQKEVLTHVTTRMNLEDMIQSEINQSQKDRYVLFHVHGGPGVVNLIETESRIVAAREGECALTV